MFAAILDRDLRAVGVLLGGTGRCHPVSSVPNRISALLRPRPFNAEFEGKHCFAAARYQVGRHD